MPVAGAIAPRLSRQRIFLFGRAEQNTGQGDEQTYLIF